jgi:uncharacterized protein (TIGR02284 family)
MSKMHDTAKLDDLIVTTIDSVKGYENSAEHADAARYADFFREMAAERRLVVTALQDESRRIEGTPADYGSTAATIHRWIEDMRVAIGGGDAALVKEVERGEDYLKEEFDRVINDDAIEPATKAVVTECYQSVLRGHDRASQLKHALEAAE